jgi:hypothetical protein
VLPVLDAEGRRVFQAGRRRWRTARCRRALFGEAIDAIVPAIPASTAIAAMAVLVEPVLLARLPPPDPLAAQIRALVAMATADRGLTPPNNWPSAPASACARCSGCSATTWVSARSG